jgi:hypothetical protein
MHVYEVRPRKDYRGVDLISDVLPVGRLCYAGLNAISNAIRGRFQGGTASAAVHRSYGCWNSKFLMTTSTSSPSVGPAWGAKGGKWFQFVS